MNGFCAVGPGSNPIMVDFLFHIVKKSSMVLQIIKQNIVMLKTFCFKLLLRNYIQNNTFYDKRLPYY